MSGYPELEQIDSFLTLNGFIRELCTNERPSIIEKVCPASILLITRKKNIQVVIDLRSGHLESATLCPDHEDDKDQVPSHVYYRQRHHDSIFKIVLYEDQESDDLNDEVKAPKELVCIPLFREAPLIFIDHEETA